MEELTNLLLSCLPAPLTKIASYQADCSHIRWMFPQEAKGVTLLLLLLPLLLLPLLAQNIQNQIRILLSFHPSAPLFFCNKCLAGILLANVKCITLVINKLNLNQYAKGSVGKFLLIVFFAFFFLFGTASAAPNQLSWSFKWACCSLSKLLISPQGDDVGYEQRQQQQINRNKERGELVNLIPFFPPPQRQKEGRGKEVKKNKGKKKGRQNPFSFIPSALSFFFLSFLFLSPMVHAEIGWLVSNWLTDWQLKPFPRNCSFLPVFLQHYWT